MKTFGLLPDQILESLHLDEQGEPIVPEGKTAVPLEKLPAPEHNPMTHAPEPVLVWHTDRVERDWRLVPLTPEQQQAAARKIWPNAQAFVAEFAPAELAGIALSTAPVVAAMGFKLTTWFGELHSDNADVVAGLDALVAAAILTPERRAQILTPHAP